MSNNVFLIYIFWLLNYVYGLLMYIFLLLNYPQWPDYKFILFNYICIFLLINYLHDLSTYNVIISLLNFLLVTMKTPNIYITYISFTWCVQINEVVRKQLIIWLLNQILLWKLKIQKRIKMNLGANKSITLFLTIFRS